MRSLRAGLLATLVALGGAAAVLPVSDAQASVSIAVTYAGLLAPSNAVCVIVPAEQKSVWENGRIYTYTRVGVQRAVAGALKSGDEAWIRTMGGIVGKVGQLVDGEAVLLPGRPSLLFLHDGPSGTYEVTARAQGQFPVVASDQVIKLVKSSAVGALYMPRGLTAQASAQVRAMILAPNASPPPMEPEHMQRVLASDVIHGRALDEVARDVAVAFQKLHAR